MFDKIKELSFALNSDADFSKYKNVKEHRAILQDMKVESQRLRNLLTSNLKEKNAK